MSKLWKIALSVAAGLALFIGLIFFSTRGAVEIADQFVSALAQADIAKARGYLSRPAQGKFDEAALKHVLSQMGILRARTAHWSGRTASANANIGAHAVLTGTIADDSGTEVPIQMGFVREHGDWKIDQLRRLTGGNRDEDVGAQRVRAENGDADAQYRLGIRYEYGKGVTQDDTEAARWYRKAAEQGIAAARNNLAALLSQGRGATKDPAEAAVWLRKAAEQGDAQAQANLGRALAQGIGTTKDEEEAARWYRKAAEQGNSDGQYLLGLALSLGRGAAKDEDEAVAWYRKAAEQGNVDAQVNLGVHLLNGAGVAKDETAGVLWTRKAAEQGNLKAQINLAKVFMTGKGVEKNEMAAAGWFRRAAERGDTEAQIQLMNSLEQGRGIPRDEAEAYFWFLVSGVNNEQARKGNETFHKNLSAQQVAEAEQRAAAWKPKP